MDDTYTYSGGKFQHLVGMLGTDTDLAIKNLFEQGVVSGLTLSELTHNLLVSKIIAMAEDGHPIVQKVNEAGAAISTEMVPALGTLPVRELVRGYLEEKEIHRDLRLLDSVAMGKFLNYMDSNQAWLAKNFDVPALKRSLPTLLQASFNEARELAQSVAKEKSAHSSQSVA